MSKTDQELLELAAKAAGTEVWTDADGNPYTDTSIGIEVRWNPLADDGDALRLVTKLGLSIHRLINKVGVSKWGVPNYLGGWSEFTFTETDDAVVRRAIVRAAAEIGAAK